ncbi:hypothetical protein HMPREF3218_0200546 [Prevotella bivia]|uniref:Uncharacterized protein n=1 Tax=Prevotella bivia TaxID=28125 RepID=A0A137STH7_9BACT|nr:hypothetical protein HMPREF3202_01627 [Prevotella bivia]KXU59653.1 hypothetical protein HMPREF3218_0200546 [Prevotella bivia]
MLFILQNTSFLGVFAFSEKTVLLKNDQKRIFLYTHKNNITNYLQNSATNK